MPSNKPDDNKIGKHKRKNANKKDSKLLAKHDAKHNGKNKSPGIYRLNKRMRKAQREAQLKGLENLTLVDPDTTPQQENLSTNWTLLQQILNKKKGNEDSSDKSIKRKFKSTENLSLNKKKRQRLSSQLSEDVGNTEDGVEESSANVALIDSLANDDSNDTSQNGKKIAWFKKVDSKLLDDDIIASEGDNDSADESASEDEAVEFDMDELDNVVEECQQQKQKKQEKKRSKAMIKKLDDPVALDCEMVGVGFSGEESVVARVSIVDMDGKVLYDKYVTPNEPVTDYRTAVSGIEPHHLENGEDLWKVQLEVSSIIKGKVLVGHAIHNDLSVLLMSHPAHLIRDTTKYMMFRSKYTRCPSLKELCKDFLKIIIQKGPHDSIEDARAVMKLYQSVQTSWEDYISSLDRAQIKKLSKLGTVLLTGSRRKKKLVTNKPGKVTKKKNRKNKKR